ncbi:SNF2-related protein [Algibacter mikhailovii]|uniref:SNF2-related protein n=1 Tax=Algibacter mikhailovii TaxID=425498 RepID=UPI002495A819|nr:SNF2-related protein [Algibacter mikhailovii]
MIKINHFAEYFQFQVIDNIGDTVIFDDWLSYLKDAPFFNVINDLLVNGNAIKGGFNTIKIKYEDLNSLDDFEYKTLQLPDPYPFDIFIDIVGSGLKDLNLKLKYSFQDFAHKNGSGNILFGKDNLTGGHLNKGETAYLLSTDQYKLVQEINSFNERTHQNSNDVLKSISSIQEKASLANAVLSKILVDTLIVAPSSFKLDIEKIGDDKYKLVPIIDNVNDDVFNKKFGIFPRIKDEYSYRDENKKIRVVLDDERNDSNNSVKSELEKVKVKKNYTSDELNDIYNEPTRFWDSDLIDLDDFGERVIELGIYQPKFYPFISPYKSEWIPGFAIEDKQEGTRLIQIENESELALLEQLFDESQKNGEKSVRFKGEDIDNRFVPPLIDVAKRQLANPKDPVTSSEIEGEKDESQTKVLIIKENTENLDFTREAQVFSDLDYNFQEITNIADFIKLKDHQKTGIAWLQTLFEPPYNAPGALLADDMGLGKTLQVLYFIEWFSQKGNDKPILIVAPVSLLENWQNEYEKFFPNPSRPVETLWGPNVKNYIVVNDSETTKKNLNVNAIFLTTYETLRKQQIPMALVHWGIVILDEAQKIKTPGTLVTNAAKALQTEFKIAMTGTPVENSLMDLWCIVDFCSPGLLECAKSFSNKYQKPLKDEDTNLSELSVSLRNEIGSSLMRRMKVDVAKDLPSIEYFRFEEEMPLEQFNIYKNELADIERLKGIEGSVNPVLQGLFNLRSISDHPYLKHYQIENFSTADLISVSAKLKKVISLLNDIRSSGEKAIIFTENKSMQRVFRKIINEYYEILPSIINGETPSSKSKSSRTKLSRQQEIDKYQNKAGFNVIIMSPIAAGFGLNITEANHVIHYTRHWNPAKEQQATDRAYRIGQQKPVKVYYPMAIAPNKSFKTFDSVLDELLERKSNLASSTLFPTEQIEISKSDFLNSLTASDDIAPIELFSIDDIDNLQPDVFVAAIAVLIEKVLGGEVLLTKNSQDNGVDVLVLKAEQNLLIGVKQSSSILGVSSCQEIQYKLPEYSKAYDVIIRAQVITNNFYSSSTLEFAKENNIELFDRNNIINWINKHPINLKEIEGKLNALEFQTESINNVGK